MGFVSVYFKQTPSVCNTRVQSFQKLPKGIAKLFHSSNSMAVMNLFT